MSPTRINDVFFISFSAPKIRRLTDFWRVNNFIVLYCMHIMWLNIFADRPKKFLSFRDNCCFSAIIENDENPNGGNLKSLYSRLASKYKECMNDMKDRAPGETY